MAILGARGEQLRMHPQGGLVAAGPASHLAIALWFGPAQPDVQFVGMLWIDSSFGRPAWVLKRWDGAIWQNIGVTSSTLLHGVLPVRVDSSDPDNLQVVSVDVMSPSGPDHAAGICADPGDVAGSTRFWCEDATWSEPS